MINGNEIGRIIRYKFYPIANGEENVGACVCVREGVCACVCMCSLCWKFRGGERVCVREGGRVCVREGVCEVCVCE